MQPYFTTDPRDASTCKIAYDESNNWLRATWSGFVDPLEANKGAESYLHYAAQSGCTYLLNDNSRLRGPWFDSLDWLAQVWLPQATTLGLRAVAHIVQADQQSDTLTNHLPLALPFDLQVFHSPADAEHWLRQQSQPPAS